MKFNSPLVARRRGQRINPIDYDHQPCALLYQAHGRKIGGVFTLPSLRDTPTMKHPLLFGLTLSLLAANAFAMPAAEQKPSAEARPAIGMLDKTVAQEGCDRLVHHYQRVG